MRLIGLKIPQLLSVALLATLAMLNTGCPDKVVCGDGVIGEGEVCDDGNMDFDDGCSSTCQVEAGWDCTGEPSTCTMSMGFCGDGTMDAGEECDDGNNMAGDGCSATCTIEGMGVCGDGTLDMGEECDDGNTMAGDGCSDTCTIEGMGTCGDGVVDAGEDCDDSGESATCNIDCTTSACGDNVVNTTAGEACDDGNTTTGDGCDDMCAIEIPVTCGDGVVDMGEDCDDSGESATCNINCTTSACGDGVPNATAGEDCDASGESMTCNIDCTTSACGDTVLNMTAGETCDDGNTMAGDGCDASCIIEVAACGNGTLDLGEECDDGGTATGDGCDDLCVVEPGYVCPMGMNCVMRDGTCAAPLELVLTDNAGSLEGQAMGDTTGAADDVSTALCDVTGAGDAGNHVYEFTIPDVRDVLITLTGAHDTIVRLLSASCDVTSELVEPGDTDGCSDGFGAGGSESLVFTLSAGTYYIVVDGFTAGDEGAYTLDVSAGPTLCGNGAIDGFEGCDDNNSSTGDGCSDICTVEPLFVCDNTTPPSVCVPSCGDGIVDFGATEECDDGNGTSGDRCSDTCLLEYNFAEVEPNDSEVDADIVFDDDIVSGSIGVNGDWDIYEFTITAPSMVFLETYTSIDGDSMNYDGFGIYGSLLDCLLWTGSPSRDTRIRLFDSTGDVSMNGTEIVSDDDDGDNTCSYIGGNRDAAAALPAGTYYIKVQHFNDGNVIARYILDVQIAPLLNMGDPCDPVADACDPGQGLACDAMLLTCQAPPLDRSNWEQYSSGGDDFDLENTQLDFFWTGTDYSVASTGGWVAFPEAAGTGTVATTDVAATITDDGNVQVTFTSFSFPFYGTSYTDVYVASNGYLTFGAGDTDFTESVADHFDLPRISWLFDDLSSQTGSLDVDEFADHVNITYDVPGFLGSDINQAQITLWLDGRITITYLQVDQNDGLVGISAGDNLGNPPAESDFSATVGVALLPEDLVINEYMVDPDTSSGVGFDSNCDGVVNGSEDEFLELVNVSGVYLDLGGVEIDDAAGNNSVLAPVALPPGASYVIFGGGAPACTGFRWETASNGFLGYNNSADSIIVRDSVAGTVVVETAYTAYTSAVSSNLDGDLNDATAGVMCGPYVDHSAVAGAVGDASPGLMSDGTAF